MRGLFIFDIDGTLADLTHRLHHIQGERKNWDEFYSSCDLDSPIEPVITVMDSLIDQGFDVWHFTGRTESVWEKTKTWLLANTSHWDQPIVMRPDGDTRPDYVVKQEMLDNMLDVDRERLIGVFDDRQQVVDMWRRNGIKCFQVAKGDF